MENIKLDLNIYNIWYTPFWEFKYFWLICICFFIMTLFPIFYFIRKKILGKNKNKIVTVSDLINQLHLLKQEINVIDVKQFYCDLIFIIKHFILVNYKYNYFSKTEEELIVFLESENISNVLIKEIKDLMHNAQYIKFSKKQISKIQMENNLQKSIELLMTLNKNSDTTSNNKTT